MINPQISAKFVLEPLPFGKNALEPFISSNTISTHHGRHQSGYVKKLNAAVPKYPFLEDMTVEQVIERGSRIPVPIINVAAQIFNHEFYWNCINPV